jgi:outer membrane protein OmpA-like peptidoglycan-associated protein
MPHLKSIRSRFCAATRFLVFCLPASMQPLLAEPDSIPVDTLVLVQAANNRAFEKDNRSDAEYQLLSTGQLPLDDVNFKSGDSIVSSNSKPYLNDISKMLLKYPKLQIEVGGHTDNTGDSEYNIDLSRGRAESVRDYLIKVAPALSSRLSARGYGMRLPKADNRTKKGRSSNWRVLLRVINTHVLAEYSQR